MSLSLFLGSFFGLQAGQLFIYYPASGTRPLTLSQLTSVSRLHHSRPAVAPLHREKAEPVLFLCMYGGVGELWPNSYRQRCGLLLMYRWSKFPQWPPQPHLGSALGLGCLFIHKWSLSLVLTAPNPATCWGMELVEPEHFFCSGWGVW